MNCRSAHNPAKADASRYSIRFVCHGGELEIKSLLLALSLRQYLPDVEIIACTPSSTLGFERISDETLAAFKQLDISTTEIQNPFGLDYPIANKIAALEPSTDARYKIFLDSDILCCGDFLSVLPDDFQFAAAPADLNSFSGTETSWRTVYEAAGLELPEQRIEATISGEKMLPYFNAGVILVDATLPFAENWIDLAQAIDALPDIPNKRPHLDQIALPVAAARLGVGCKLLDAKFNLPAHLRALPDDALLAHYHYPTCIRREPELRSQVQYLAATSSQLTALMKANKEWAAVLRHRFSSGGKSLEGSAKPPGRNLVITGIPRSGTSYLCRLLHRFGDCVVVNEPAEVFDPLQRQRIPYGLGVVYGRLRQRILDGEPIKNKFANEELTSDTAEAHEVSTYRPEVSRADFVLGTKNTLAYLARLDAIRTALPGAKIVACVRNPWDVIASWKTSFPHLRNADVKSLPVVGLNSRFLSSGRRNELQTIADMTCPARRRAAFWAYLARLVHIVEDKVAIVRYEDLIECPAREASAIVSACFGAPSERVVPLPARKRDKRYVLNDKDLNAIKEFCEEIAIALGVGDRSYINALE